MLWKPFRLLCVPISLYILQISFSILFFNSFEVQFWETRRMDGEFYRLIEVYCAVLILVITWIVIGLHMFNIRSSHQRCSVRKGVPRNFAKFTGKHLWQSFFFNKVARLRPATLLKKTLWHRFFPVNLAKFLRTLFYRTPLDDYFFNIFY